MELFNDAAYVDVVGTSKGKGFQGVVKRPEKTPLLHPKSKATMTLEEMLQMERKRKKKQKYDDEEHRIQTQFSQMNLLYHLLWKAIP